MSRLAHHVFFVLKDRDDQRVNALINACKKYLTEHPGLVDFSVGRREVTLDRPVNHHFDVSLHCVFDSRENHDLYQDAPRHHEFIAEQKDNWESVLVCDSVLEDV